MTIKSGAQSGAVALIQRFGSALNLNPHFHMLYLNGIYDAKGDDLDVIAHTIASAFHGFWKKQVIWSADEASEKRGLQATPTDDDTFPIDGG